jgi:hypothetical protein
VERRTQRVDGTVNETVSIRYGDDVETSWARQTTTGEGSTEVSHLRVGDRTFHSDQYSAGAKPVGGGWTLSYNSGTDEWTLERVNTDGSISKQVYGAYNPTKNTQVDDRWAPEDADGGYQPGEGPTTCDTIDCGECSPRAAAVSAFRECFDLDPDAHEPEPELCGTDDAPCPDDFGGFLHLCLEALSLDPELRCGDLDCGIGVTGAWDDDLGECTCRAPLLDIQVSLGDVCAEVDCGDGEGFGAVGGDLSCCAHDAGQGVEPLPQGPSVPNPNPPAPGGI